MKDLRNGPEIENNRAIPIAKTFFYRHFSRFQIFASFFTVVSQWQSLLINMLQDTSQSLLPFKLQRFQLFLWSRNELNLNVYDVFWLWQLSLCANTDISKNYFLGDIAKAWPIHSCHPNKIQNLYLF